MIKVLFYCQQEGHNIIVRKKKTFKHCPVGDYSIVTALKSSMTPYGTVSWSVGRMKTNEMASGHI